MSEDRVVELRHPGSFSEDPLTVVLRSGAQRLLAQAVEMEVTAFIAAHGDLEDDAGRHRVVRHGHHRERQVQTGIGPVAVRCPRVRDRGGAGEAGKIRFTSAILPPCLRRAKSIEELLPWLYLKGISTGDFTEALAALPGPLADAPGLSASTITRLKDVWQCWRAGKSATSRPGAISISGPTGSISSPGWSTTNNASWSSSAPTSGAARNCWQSPTAIARAPSRGASCCSISSGAASRWRPSWPSETGRSASGRPCARATARRANSAAGCTRPATF